MTLWVSLVVSTELRIAAGRLSLSSIWASATLTKAPVSGAVCVLFRMPTTVNVWFTKSGLASLGRTGRSIESPAFFLNSLAKSDPRMTSPCEEGESSWPEARLVWKLPYEFSPGPVL